jgi:Tfp pilus assembly protein PilO
MPPKQNAYWWLIGLNLLLLGGLAAAGWRYSALAGELQTKKLAAAELTRARAILASQQEALEATAATRAKLDSYFVSADNLSVFIEELEKLAAAASVGLNLSSAKLDNKNPPAAYFTLEIGGSFTAVYKFLGLVENMPFILTLRQVQLDAGQDDKGTKLWRGGLTLQLNSLTPTKTNEETD